MSWMMKDQKVERQLLYRCTPEPVLWRQCDRPERELECVHEEGHHK